MAVDGSLVLLEQETTEGQVIKNLPSPVQEAEKWLRRQQEERQTFRIDIVGEAPPGRWLTATHFTHATLYVVLGCGLGYHIQALAQVISDDSAILIIDTLPEKNLIRLARQVSEIDKLLAEDRVRFECTDHIALMAAHIHNELQARLLRDIRILNYSPASGIIPAVFSEWEQQVLERTQQEYVYTLLHQLNANALKNAWRNFPYILSNPGVAELKEGARGIPAVIVSSGPSLNGNIDVLSEYTENVLIIACGSAVGALFHRGIIPHFLVVSDPFDNNYAEIETFIHPETILVASYYAMGELVERFPGNRMFFQLADLPLPFPFPGLQEQMPESGVLKGAASVASNAFSFAMSIEANPVILIGQDCSFPNNQSHADGVQAHSYADWVADSYEYVDGYYGGQVKTMPSFRELLNFFAEQLSQLPAGRQVINATEGGAYIRGAQHMTLRAALQTCGHCEQNLRMVMKKKWLQHRPVAHSRERSLERLSRYRSRIHDLIAKIYRDKNKLSPAEHRVCWNMLPEFPGRYQHHAAYQQVSWFLQLQIKKIKTLVREEKSVEASGEFFQIVREYQI
ncbi:MAG TPA: 6-hydroxymethylpterin diphosphokinase MptE-like protein, partial [Patescibacteria group bacterium]|nr:6-hydroxymethylpterin diphosphokinase MptE-like protein [Patescibacteria group bacterium]